MQVQHEEKDRRGRHFINDKDGNTVAEITYLLNKEDTIVIDHTGVDQSLQGKNIGLQLVEAVVMQARSEGKKITPMCTFAKAIIEKKEEFRDVLA